MKYRADIDGLRALAVLSVVGFHYGFSRWIGGGYVGVDVFFVISGFLITRIIFSQIATRTYSIVDFYHRRARRIFPALFVVFGASMAAACVLRLPSEIEDAGRSILASIFFVSNILFFHSANYFDGKLAADPSLHTWSLSVEEQFYILFPILVFFIRKASVIQQKVAIAFVFALSFVAAEVAVHQDKDAAFYLVVFRAWELLAGALLALDFFPSIRRRSVAELTAAAGLAAILYADFRFTSATSFPGFSAAVPCFGAAAIIHAGTSSSTMASRLLSLPPIRFIGLVSYSLYLWHWPLWVFGRDVINVESTLAKLAFLGLALVIATVSWAFIERPFRKTPYRLSPVRTLQVAGGAMLGLALLSMSLGPLSARLRPLPIVAQRELAWFDAPTHPEMRPATCFMISSGHSRDAFEHAGCLSMSATQPNVLIMGDSQAAHLWYGYAQEFPTMHFLQASASGCKPVLHAVGEERCTTLMQRTMTEFLPAHHLQAIVLSARWVEDDVPAAIATAKALLPFADRVVISGPIEEYGHALPRLLAAEAIRGLAPGSIANEFLLRDPIRAEQRFAASTMPPGVHYVSVQKALCTPKCVLLAQDNVPLQFDFSHLTPQGSRLLARRVGAEALGLSPSERPQDAR